MIGIKTFLLLSLSVVVLVSGYQGDRDQDAYLDTLLKRLVDLETRSKIREETARVDDLAATRSMSGINVDDGVKTAYNDLKNDRMYSWIICKIDGTRTSIVIESKAKGTFDEFVAALKSSGEPRYAVYDTPAEWGQKLVYISWIPDDSDIKLKMLYGSSDDALVKLFTGLVVKPLKFTNRNDPIKDKIMNALSQIS